MELVALDPRTYPCWDDLAARSAQSTVFHTAAWASVLCDAYGYVPQYLCSMGAAGFSACIPFMEIPGPFGGKKAVGLPFSDFCGPLIENEVQGEAVFESVVAYARSHSWKSIEVRGELGCCGRSAHYRGHELVLAAGDDEQSALLRDTTRRNVEKAVASGVTAAIEFSAEALASFRRLNELTRRRHGLPPQPARFFNQVYRHLLAPGRAFIVLGLVGGRPVAAALFLLFEKTALFKYGASDIRYQSLRPNNLVMWRGIRECAARGCSRLLFGRTDEEHTGLRRFKTGWGAREYPIGYCSYNMAAGRPAGRRYSVSGFKTALCRRMPLPLLRFAGNMLYRYSA
jgi:hypothetical protein